MGGLLDKPEKSKDSAVGAGLGFRWALSGMQGWRKSMEDAHIAFVEEKAGELHT